MEGGLDLRIDGWGVVWRDEEGGSGMNWFFVMGTASIGHELDGGVLGGSLARRST